MASEVATESYIRWSAEQLAQQVDALDRDRLALERKAGAASALAMLVAGFWATHGTGFGLLAIAGLSSVLGACGYASQVMWPLRSKRVRPSAYYAAIPTASQEKGYLDILLHYVEVADDALSDVDRRGRYLTKAQLLAVLAVLFLLLSVAKAKAHEDSMKQSEPDVYQHITETAR